MIPVSAFEIIRLNLRFVPIILILPLYYFAFPFVKKYKRLGLRRSTFFLAASVFDLIAIGSFFLVKKNFTESPTLLLGIIACSLMLMAGAFDTRPPQFKNPE